MEISKEKSETVLRFNKDESIVLLDWLSRFNEGEHGDLFEDSAEERLLWDIEAILEKEIAVTFEANYDVQLRTARLRLRDE